MAAPNVWTFADDTFDQIVLALPIPVFVHFWAPWCGPCVMMEQTIDSLSDDFDGRVAVGKLNIDENPKTAERFDIRSIPTMLLFKNGAVVHRGVGLVHRSDLTRLLKKHGA